MLKRNDGNILINCLVFITLFVGVNGYMVPNTWEGSNKGRIVGGAEISIETAPYQVSVRLQSNTLLHICGGSINAPRVVITAAHCIKGRYASHIFIVAGKSSIQDQEPALKSLKLIYNSGYNKKAHLNDVGLIILSEKLVYSFNIKPITLATQEPKIGFTAIVTGWGKDDENAKILQNNLQKVELKIVDSDYCNLQYSAKGLAITDEMICAAVEDYSKDSCQGDSGGPLVVNGELAGIVSWGIGCARAGFPGVYVSIPYHTQWIAENAEPFT